MKLLNLGCGATRPGDPWTNLDNLSTQLHIGTPERAKLDSELNYIDSDITRDLPLAGESFDGCLLSHVLEHFCASEGLRILQEVHRVLKPGGIVLVSVPDASYFRKVYPEDRKENWQRLFGVTDPNNTIPTWFEAALWFDQHKAIFTEDVLWAYLTRAGFPNMQRVNPNWIKAGPGPGEIGTPMSVMCEQLNRLEFSVVLSATK